MAIEETSRFCRTCQGQRLARRQGVNTALHLILTILTCGLWGFVWLGSAIRFGGWRCAFCGSKV